jgi:hypothetical protein
MVGSTPRGDERGVSEILGTTFVISLSLLSALAVIALGTVTIQGVTDHSTDSVGQQSIEEMQQRLSTLSGESIDSSTTFEFPDGTGDDVQMDPDEGTVKIIVENATNKAETEFDLGTITHETSDGRKLIFQGGALFAQSSPGSARLVSEPEFDFADGQLDLSLTQIDSSDRMSEREQITAERLAEESQEHTDGVLTDIGSVWQVMSDGMQYDVEPVDITVTFQTEYYRGWEAYASNYMTELPDNTDVSSNQNTVTLEFDDVGEKSNLASNINSEFNSNNNDVIYAGHSQYAKLHDDIDDAGDQKLEIDSTSYTVAVYDNSGSNGPWAIHDSTDNWEYYPRSGGMNPDSSDLDGFDDNNNNNNDVWGYDDDLPICVVDGGTSDMEDAIDDGDCFKQMIGVAEPGSLDPDSNFTISTVKVNTSTRTVEAEITNEGYKSETQHVTLVDVNSSAVVDSSDRSITVGTTETVTLWWDDGGTSELTGSGEIRVETENDAETRSTGSSGSSPNSDFTITIDQVAPSAPQYGDSVSVDIDLKNQGSNGDIQNVILKLDGSTVDLESVDLGTSPPGDEESITLNADMRGVSRTADLTVSTDDETKSRAVLVDPKPLPDADMQQYKNPIAVSIDHVKIRD